MANENIFEPNLEITASTREGGVITGLEINNHEIPLGSSKLENNKAATIDASTYTEPVVITPSAGKDGMKKATVTLSNIPSGADLEANKAETIDVSDYSTPVEITPSSGKDGMEKVTVTLENIPSGSDLEANKAATIDVSQYSSPVEITPTAGKDGMEKATVTLTNIPSGGSATAYCWKPALATDFMYLPFSVAPDEAPSGDTPTIDPVRVSGEMYIIKGTLGIPEGATYTKVSDTEFQFQIGNVTAVFTRDSTKDFTLW